MDISTKLFGAAKAAGKSILQEGSPQSVVSRALNSAAGHDSYVSYTQSTRVEPAVIVDYRLSNFADITAVMQSVLSIFSGYYLQSIAINATLGDINIIKTLDQLNPNRSVLKNASMFLGNEGLEDTYKWGLPTESLRASVESLGLEETGDEIYLLDDDAILEEAKKLEEEIKKDKAKAEKKNQAKSFRDEYKEKLSRLEELEKLKEERDLSDEEASRNSRRGEVTSKAIDVAQSAANLAIGHLLEVKFQANGHNVTIPVNVRLITSLSTPENIINITSNLFKNRTVKERYHAWREGQLSGMRDLVLVNDLIDAHRNAMIKDNTGIYREIYSRKNKNLLSALISKAPSVGDASNIMILSKETADRLEMEINGELTTYNVRKKIFDASSLMLMVVVDTDYEMVFIYHRGIRKGTELQVNQIKSTNKKGGTDIAEVVKAFSDLSAPRY